MSISLLRGRTQIFGKTCMGVEMAGFNADLEHGDPERRKDSARDEGPPIEKADARHKRDLFGILLEFERNHVGFTLIVLTIVHGDLLVGPSTGECVGTHQNYVSLIGNFEL